MGEVYLAEDQKLGRNVALKILQQDFFDNEERLERFRREAQTAAKVNHQHVMGIFDIGSVQEPPLNQEVNYIVMEYVDGDELSDYLRDKNPNMSGRIRLAEKIASGLAAAHKLNIVHRDIKAENIIINADGDPKILDFGLAKPLDPVFSDETDGDTDTISRELTKAGKIMGTVTYMSPEQARGDQVDVRSDIFSFGVLLYQMATGIVPFSGKTQMSTLAKILETKHESPTTVNADIPTELERIINKCLQKDASDRYQDTRDLVVDLRNLRRLGDSGVTDTVSTLTHSSTMSRTFLLRGKKLWITVGAVVGLALVVSYIADFNFTVTGNQPLQAHENSLAILSFENKTGDDEYSWLETGLPEILLTDLSQTEALHLISWERILDCFEDREASHSIDDCENAAKSLGAVRTLSGAIYKFGEQIRIDARLEDITTGKIMMAEKVVGADPFPLVDSLIGKIAASLDLTDEFSSEIDRARLTSTSSEAYRLYHHGHELMFKDRNSEALRLFHQAIEVDSGFALPYMRIGMINFFENRQKEGKKYLAEAFKRRGKLPLRDKMLLDIYGEIWLSENYDQGFTMMKSFVSNYPDDKEGRTIYAILINVFQKDTVATFAHFDTVLGQDPTYQFALEQYAQIYQQLGNTEKAVEFAEKLKKAHPDSPEGVKRLASLYADDGKLDKAIATYLEALDKFPSGDIQKSVLPQLIDLSIRKRDFKAANEYNERDLAAFQDDPYEINRYYHQKANLLNWEGKFAEGMHNRHEALKAGLITGDSNIIYVDYLSIGRYFDRFEMTDSSQFYARKAREWVPEMSRLNYGLQLASSTDFDCEGSRKDFESAVEMFRARTPQGFWGVIEPLEGIYTAHCNKDTMALISGYRSLIETQGGQGDGNKRNLAHMLILTDSPAEGIEIMKEMFSDFTKQTTAYHHLNDTYLMGIGYQKLGDNKKAIQYFKEVLSLWNEADYQIEPIVKSREFLQKLTG